MVRSYETFNTTQVKTLSVYAPIIVTFSYWDDKGVSGNYSFSAFLAEKHINGEDPPGAGSNFSGDLLGRLKDSLLHAYRARFGEIWNQQTVLGGQGQAAIQTPPGQYCSRLKLEMSPGFSFRRSVGDPSFFEWLGGVGFVTFGNPLLNKLEPLQEIHAMSSTFVPRDIDNTAALICVPDKSSWLATLFSVSPPQVFFQGMNDSKQAEWDYPNYDVGV